jgi:predicted ATPase
MAEQTDKHPDRERESVCAIERVRLLRDYRGKLVKAQDIELRPLTLLVGDQGCGKTSLLNLLREAFGQRTSVKQEQGVIDADVNLAAWPVKIFAQDFEREQARFWTSPHQKGELGSGLIDEIAAMFISHGQSQLQELQLRGVMHKAPVRCLVLYDEPETALSPRSCYRLAADMVRAAEHGHQVIASVHNPILIEAADEVYSVEHSQWMTPADFLATQRT